MDVEELIEVKAVFTGVSGLCVNAVIKRHNFSTGIPALTSL